MSSREWCQMLVHARRQHPAWSLLAARRAPLILACLQSLLQSRVGGVDHEEAVQSLAAMLGEYANDPDFEVGTSDPDELLVLARRESAEWISRRLLTEREGKLQATDALQHALGFVSGLRQRIMTSTASRLATVQREAEALALALSPDAEARAAALERRIEALQAELADVRAGRVQVLAGAPAIEGMKNLYELAMGLRADFRRVEDSYREADRALRETIISQQQNRGQVLDSLLDSHDALLQSPEGHVFHGFYEQLQGAGGLTEMAARLKEIRTHALAASAFNDQQRSDLHWLIPLLVRESRQVMDARARSESDVRSFMQTGLAAEHHRVGQLVQQVLHAALGLDWSRQALRRTSADVPPVALAFAQGNHQIKPLDRLVYSDGTDAPQPTLSFDEQPVNLHDMDDAFWAAFDTLDEAALLARTAAVLVDHPDGLHWPDLVRALPPEHDLQTLAVWLDAALHGGADAHVAPRVQVPVTLPDGGEWQFELPDIPLTPAALQRARGDVVAVEEGQ
ncbi:DUF3375 family protein [Ottowia sp. SB7-C50]|uniref:DUF3375 family protein n=1 Tax=Ottowia sp. SB7-C50 TaxID=3081231 RepID=UPI002952C3C3|nr:DUF3375 family protein [Ottowia sp. SB7-C50]WOP14196.1 DUF3375 family protein [Ottowia sp. SB7-C50]